MERPSVYIAAVAKHLVDIDEQALDMARAELGTTTIEDTVNAALRHARAQRERRVAAALDSLATAPPEDRAEAWR
jgi:Arc/MetJ family transcription regulator